MQLTRSEHLQVLIEIPTEDYEEHKKQIEAVDLNFDLKLPKVKNNYETVTITWDFYLSYYGQVEKNLEDITNLISKTSLGPTAASLEALDQQKCIFQELILTIDQIQKELTSGYNK